MRHPDPLHDPPRPLVHGRGKGHNLVDAESFEPVGEHNSCAFGGIPVSPKLLGEAPADLDCRREVRFEGRLPQPDVASEQRRLGYLHRPEAEALLFKRRFGPIDECIALLEGEGRGKVLHHHRIRVECSERDAVGVGPSMESQPVGPQFTWSHVSILSGPPDV